MGGEQRLGEDVVEGEDAEELDDHALIDRSAHPFRGHVDTNNEASSPSNRST